MSETEKNPDDQKSGGTHRRPRLMERTMREPLGHTRVAAAGLSVERLGEIVRDPESPHREVLSAVSLHPDGQQDQPGEYCVDHSSSKTRGIGRARV